MARSDFDPGPILADHLDMNWSIVYRDGQGNTSRRVITVQSLHGTKYPKYAYAYCHLRKEMRHFNLYNVVKAEDLESGEEVPVTNHLLDWIEDIQEMDSFFKDD